MTAVDPAALREQLDAADGWPVTVVIEGGGEEDAVALTIHGGAVYVATIHDRGRRSADQPGAWARLLSGAANALPDLLTELETYRAASGAIAALYAGDRDRAANILEELRDEGLESFAVLLGDLKDIALDCLGRRHG